MTEVDKNCSYYKDIIKDESLADYITRLEQENKELLETLTKGCYQNLQHECRIWELKESKYRSALEEINKIAEPRFVNGLNEEADLCNLTMDRIQNIINEVLQ